MIKIKRRSSMMGGAYSTSKLSPLQTFACQTGTLQRGQTLGLSVMGFQLYLHFGHFIDCTCIGVGIGVVVFNAFASVYKQTLGCHGINSLSRDPSRCSLTLPPIMDGVVQ